MRRTWTRVIVGMSLVLLFQAAVVTAEPVEIDLWFLFTATDREVFLDIVERFNNAQDEVRVNALHPGDPYYDKLIVVMAGGGDIPDIATIHAGPWVDTFLQAGFMQPLSETTVAEMGIDPTTYAPGLWERSVRDDMVYAIPMDFLSTALFMNYAMFDEAGLPREAPQDKRDFLNAVQRLGRDLTGDGVADQSGFTGMQDFLTESWLSFFFQEEGEFAANGQIINEDAVLTALEHMSDIKQANGGRFFGWMRNFDVAIQHDGSWNGAFYYENIPELGIATFPQWGKTNAVASGGHTFFIPRDPSRSDERQEAALRFISWFSENSYLWAQLAGHVPANRTPQLNEIMRELPYVIPFAQQMEWGRTWPNNFPGSGGYIMQYLDGDISPMQALEELKVSSLVGAAELLGTAQ